MDQSRVFSHFSFENKILIISDLILFRNPIKGQFSELILKNLVPFSEYLQAFKVVQSLAIFEKTLDHQMPIFEPWFQGLQWLCDFQLGGIWKLKP